MRLGVQHTQGCLRLPAAYPDPFQGKGDSAALGWPLAPWHPIPLALPRPKVNTRKAMAAFVEILKQIGILGPRFITDLTGVISGPKGFFERFSFDREGVLARALIFYAISVGISFVFDAPFSGKNELLIPFATKLVIFTLATVYSAAACKFSFRCVGGRAPFHNHLVVALYTSAPFGIFFSFVATACKGLVKTQAPDLYPVFQRSMDDFYSEKPLSQATIQALTGSTPTLIAFAAAVTLGLFSLVWVYVTWGCFRQINHVGRMRSFLASLVMLPVVWPAALVVMWAQRGLGLTLF
jgi:hypothetical protein